MYHIDLICVTGQHGRTVVLLNAFTLYKYIWNLKKNKKKTRLLNCIQSLHEKQYFGIAHYTVVRIILNLFKTDKGQ